MNNTRKTSGSTPTEIEAIDALRSICRSVDDFKGAVRFLARKTLQETQENSILAVDHFPYGANHSDTGPMLKEITSPGLGRNG